MAEFWSNNDRGYRIRLWIDQLPQTQNNIANNNSQVRVRLVLLNTTTTFSDYDCSAYVDLNGQRLSWSGRPSVLSYNQTIMLIDQTITIGHNADGTKTFGLMASFSGSGGFSPGTLSIGGNSFTLTTIPRATTPTLSNSNPVMGQAITISLPRASDSFTHNVYHDFLAGSWAKINDTPVGTSLNWTLPLEEYALRLTNATSGDGRIKVDTYNGGTYIGSKIVNFTASVPASVKPTFTGVTLTDTNTAVQALMTGNNFLQIMSNIQVAFNGQSGSYGSSITGYIAEIVNRNKVTNSNGGYLGMMNFNGSATIRASVVDSRGRWSDTKDVTINVIEYFAPILSFTALRTRENPSIIQIGRNANVAPITLSSSQKNIMTLSFKVAPLGSATYTADNGPASGSWTTIASLTNSPANLVGNYPANKSFTVVGILSDKFTSVEVSTTISTETVVMSYDKDGRVGIGKVVEQGKAGSLDIAGDIYAGGAPIGHYSSISITDINKALTAGVYTVSNTTINQPFGISEWGYLEIIVTNGNTHNNTSNWIWQKYATTSGKVFERYKVNSGAWTAWKSPALDQYYPIGAIYQSTVNTNPSTLMGGTWERFGNGRVLVGVDENDGDFNASIKIGGTKAHKLTAAEMAHSHIQTERFDSAYSLGNGHKFTIGETVASDTIKTSGVTDVTNQPHNNLQPYITVYMWRRTA